MSIHSFFTSRGDKPFDSTINPGKYIFKQKRNKYVLTVLDVQVMMSPDLLIIVSG